MRYILIFANMRFMKINFTVICSLALVATSLLSTGAQAADVYCRVGRYWQDTLKVYGAITQVASIDKLRLAGPNGMILLRPYSGRELRIVWNGGIQIVNRQFDGSQQTYAKSESAEQIDAVIALTNTDQTIRAVCSMNPNHLIPLGVDPQN